MALQVLTLDSLREFCEDLEKEVGSMLMAELSNSSPHAPLKIIHKNNNNNKKWWYLISSKIFCVHWRLILILPAPPFCFRASLTSQWHPGGWAGPGLELGGKSSVKGPGEDHDLLLRWWAVESDRTAFQSEVVTSSYVIWASDPNCLHFPFHIYIV